MSVQFFTTYAEYERTLKRSRPRRRRPAEIAAKLSRNEPPHRDVLRIATPRTRLEAAEVFADQFARERGSSLEELRGHRRCEPARTIRRDCINATANRFLWASPTDLGRVFHRDRTTIMQGAAVVTLWRSGQFDTKHIADLLRLSEADVANVLAAARDAERAA